VLELDEPDPFSSSDCDGCGDTDAGERHAAVAFGPEVPHVDYPHHPGTLYDCPPCEALMSEEDSSA
jgi:hypothetical protein